MSPPSWLSGPYCDDPTSLHDAFELSLTMGSFAYLRACRKLQAAAQFLMYGSSEYQTTVVEALEYGLHIFLAQFGALLDCQCALACIFLDIDRKVLDHSVDFFVILKMSSLRTIVVEDGRFKWLTALDKFICTSTKASFVTDWILSTSTATTPMTSPRRTAPSTPAITSATPTLPVAVAEQRILTTISTPVKGTAPPNDVAPDKGAVASRPRRSSRIVTRSALKRLQVEKENNDC
ncbi:hypothetical protein CYLTODRAFT_459603 [Cylindrobasidium torrendii FP15055 ss-10]|uniref:Uncharacterized protein n=1 Tax=Cylindrobasidium torrendii FP15055 ss-10 TaxID=1314674 RepID=A0A0D7AUT8_9AGAR|nr:hypothetical protein CYLTODRAFT_459603 [Cylindrobasidium torrendii FP15055 ss-10]